MAPPTVLSFSRSDGSYAMLRGPAVNTPRAAPRVLQVGLLTPCNLACSFCYRDTDAPSRLDRAFLVPLLQDAARWGVLEVAFGGGEPLLFPGLIPMLQELRRTTALGLNLTTNGLLLRGQRLDALAPLVGEIRISAYPDNRYRETLQRTRHIQTGLNLMVTPQNVGHISVLVHDALWCGADNILLLGYKGDDDSLMLSQRDRDRLREALRGLAGLPLRLGICLYPYFPDLPHLFSQSDCGAGDDFLTITPDRAVQACSFSTARHPFENFAQLKEIYTRLRRDKPLAGVGGCTRAAFPEAAAPLSDNTVWLWSERAGNNSSTYTMLADFCDAQTAQDAAEILQKFFDDVHRYYKQWNQDNGLDTDTLWRATQAEGLPPPVADFIERYELDVSSYTHGVKDNVDAPTIVGVGRQLLLHHSYCMSFDSRFFQVFFETLAGGPVRFQAYGLDGVFLLRCTARGYHEAVTEALEALLTDPYPDSPLPWMDSTPAPALWPGDQIEEGTIDGERTLALEQELTEAGLQLQLEASGNLPAIAHRLATWLTAHGYEDVTVTVIGNPHRHTGAIS